MTLREWVIVEALALVLIAIMANVLAFKYSKKNKSED